MVPHGANGGLLQGTLKSFVFNSRFLFFSCGMFLKTILVNGYCLVHISFTDIMYQIVLVQMIKVE